MSLTSSGCCLAVGQGWIAALHDGHDTVIDGVPRVDFFAAVSPCEVGFTTHDAVWRIDLRTAALSRSELGSVTAAASSESGSLYLGTWTGEVLEIPFA